MPSTFLGGGGFGKVYQGVDPETGEEVAVKEIVALQAGGCEGIDLSALREVKMLTELPAHPNVVRLHDVCFHRNNINLVFEYCPCDLLHIMVKRDTQLTPAQVKAYMLQILRSLDHLHRHGVMHRDLKPANFLVGADGELRLTDFGLARTVAPFDRYLHPSVVTLNYRAPELLLACEQHGPPVDMWAAGCVFAELMLGKLFLGNVQTSRELEILAEIRKKIAPLNSKSMPGMPLLSMLASDDSAPVPNLNDFLPKGTPANAVDLLRALLNPNPGKRPTAREALEFPYFAPTSLPPPAGRDELVRLVRQTQSTRDPTAQAEPNWRSGDSPGLASAAVFAPQGRETGGPDGKHEGDGAEQPTGLDTVKAKLF